MRRMAPVIAFVAGLIAPAFAQKAEIAAVNAKWIDLFTGFDAPYVSYRRYVRKHMLELRVLSPAKRVAGGNRARAC